MYFIVGYAPTLDKSTSKKDYFWSPLDEVDKGVPGRDHLLVLMDANARTGMRGIGWTDSKVLGAYGRDELNDNGERLLIHATDNKLSLLTRGMLHLLVVYRTRFRVLTEERPSTGLTTYWHGRWIDDWYVMSLCGPHPGRTLSRTTTSVLMPEALMT